MNAIRYNLIFYDKNIMDLFIEKMASNRGKNISQVRYAYILHDSDIIEETGEYKKPHYHLWLEFPQSVRDRDLIPMLVASGSNGSAISKQKTDRNFLAYLTHDTSNSFEVKAHYEKENIFTNIDQQEFDEMYYEAVSKIKKPNRQKQKVLDTTMYMKSLFDILEENKEICSFLELVQFLILDNDMELLEYVSNKTYFLKQVFETRFKINRAYQFTHELESENIKELKAIRQEFKEAQRVEKRLEELREKKEEYEAQVYEKSDDECRR